jgi:hypothetical protein
MSETLQARLGLSSPGANPSLKKTWKKAKPKPYAIEDHQAPAWSSPCATPSYEPDGGQQLPSLVSPSLIDRLGPKVTPPQPRRSLLERMELDDNETAEVADTGVVASSESNCMPLDGVPYSKVVRDEDSEVRDAENSAVYRHSSEDGEPMDDIRPINLVVRYGFNDVSSFLTTFRLEPDRGTGQPESLACPLLQDLLTTLARMEL